MSDKLKYRENKRIAAMIACVKDATDDDGILITVATRHAGKTAALLEQQAVEIVALKKEIAALTFRADSAEAELRLYHKIVRTGRG